MSSIKQFIKKLVLPPLEAAKARKRQSELKAVRPVVSHGDLVAGLQSLPVADGATVLVHSSLKSLGFVEGGAGTLAQALSDVFAKANRGTVLIPTFSIDGTMLQTLESGRPFDVRQTPSTLGALPEAFRRLPGVSRSVHPTHSFAAIGRRAEELTSGHHLADTNFGDGTPMVEMLSGPSYLLGLGTTLGNVTFYHCLEDREAFPFDVYAPQGPFEVEVTDQTGASHLKLYQAHRPGDLPQRRIDNPKAGARVREAYTAHMEAHGGLSWHQVCEARSWLVDAREFYREIKTLMAQNLTVYATEDQLTTFERAAQSGS